MHLQISNDSAELIESKASTLDVTPDGCAEVLLRSGIDAQELKRSALFDKVEVYQRCDDPEQSAALTDEPGDMIFEQ